MRFIQDILDTFLSSSDASSMVLNHSSRRIFCQKQVNNQSDLDEFDSINIILKEADLILPVLKSLGPDSSTPAINNATPKGLGYLFTKIEKN